LGLAYKKDINDTRETPAFKIMRRLDDMGAKISYHDPFVPEIQHTRQWPEAPVLKSQPLTEKNITAKDAIMIITDHTPVDYKLIAKHAKLIIDSRGVYRKPMKNVVKA
ncbi:MAG TPA: UDP binding domain-containing protein, partial [Smithella sp.]|nr:UDP binding domain-containing protein [Smithella sp.]